MSDFNSELKARITVEYNQGVSTTALEIAKRRCPQSPMYRASLIVGTSQRKYPRLSTTIYAKQTPTGLMTLASDDDRAKWLEDSGVKEHLIHNKPDNPLGLMWKTVTGKTVTGWYNVMHPGFRPKPFLAPAMWEFEREFAKRIKGIVVEVAKSVARQHGLI